MQSSEVKLTIDTAATQQLLAEFRAVVIRFETSVNTLSALLRVVDKKLSIPDYPKTFA